MALFLSKKKVFNKENSYKIGCLYEQVTIENLYTETVVSDNTSFFSYFFKAIHYFIIAKIAWSKIIDFVKVLFCPKLKNQ